MCRDVDVLLLCFSRYLVHDSSVLEIFKMQRKIWQMVGESVKGKWKNREMVYHLPEKLEYGYHLP
jgi:hypothetical protein